MKIQIAIVVICMTGLTTAVQFHTKQKIGERCGMDELEREIYVCDHGLNCDTQTNTCQRWYIEVEKGQKCGTTDIADINCAHPATCLEGVCVEFNKMVGATCGEYEMCHRDYKCVNGECETYPILYRMREWVHKLI